MEFVNRETELKFLEKEYKKNEASFIPIYGRRRVGKTTLIEKFIENKNNSIYYFASEQEVTLQIEEFKFQILKIISNDFLQNQKFSNWGSFFDFLKNIWPKKEKIILVIDEITYIIKQTKAFSSILQRFWDEFLSKTNTIFIVSGSMQSLMLKEILGYSAPLYGRRSGQIHLKEFTFKETCLFFKNLGLKDIIEIYSLVGGTAKYLNIAKIYFNAKSLIKEEFLNVNSFFNNEAILLLAVEFREVALYNNILKAISIGKTSLNDISNYIGVEDKKVFAYLEILLRLNFIRKEIPIVADERKFRGAIYLINDNFLKFWYGFIDKVRSEIEIKRIDDAMNYININFIKHVSFIFEDISREFLLYETNFRYKIGKTWGNYRKNNEKKSYEIDICGIGENGEVRLENGKNNHKRILFGECKWQDNVDGVQVLKKLQEKTTYVKWFNDNRKEEFVLFAKSFKTKPKNCKCYDLKAIEKVFRSRK